ncbi:MAG: hypothetical protein JXB05_28160 [Myxococcaceae bacterium]|nr:hypothetical protein [Myxococcaceae bacterium]
MRLFLLLLVLVAGSAPAQEVAPPLVRAPEEPEAPSPPPSVDAPVRLVPGADVRVETRSERVSGAFRLLEPGALSLQVDDERVETLLLADVQRLSVKKRAVLPGLVIGTGAGAMGTALFAAFLCAVVEDAGSSLSCGLVGALIGSVPGAVAGALVGLAVPRWSTVYRRAEPDDPPAQVEEARPPPSSAERWFFHPGAVGELGLRVGYARRLGGVDPQGGQGARLHLLALLGPYLALGPELALYARAGSETLIIPGGGVFSQEEPLFQLGAVTRVGVELGRVRPAALLGLAWYLGQFSYIGYSVGAEVELRLVEWLPLAVDVRYHDNVQNLSVDPRHLTVGLGSRLSW